LAHQEDLRCHQTEEGPTVLSQEDHRHLAADTDYEECLLAEAGKGSAVLHPEEVCSHRRRRALQEKKPYHLLPRC